MMATTLALVVLLGASCKVEGGPSDVSWNEFIAPYSHWVQMDGYKMHYVDIGRGPAVMLIHGYADSTYCWHENVLPLLDAGLRVILVDNPGLGRSQRPPEDFVLSAENLSEEVLKLADKLDLKKFSVVGNSMGGGISIHLSLFYPERIDRAVLVDPACFPQKKAGMLQLIGLPGSNLVMGKWAIAQALKQVYYDANLVDEMLINEYARPMADPAYKEYLVKLLDQYPSPAAMQMYRRYGEIKRPTLIIWGDHDRWVPPSFGPRLQKSIPGSRLIMVKNAGHIPNQERPEIVNPILVSFLTE